MAGELSYRLVDAWDSAVAAPYTFFLPADEDVERLAPGDYVKLIFDLIPPGENYGAERMWVRLTAAEGDSFVGTLENDPCEGRMRAGDEVAFTGRAIIDILWSDGTRATLVGPSGDFWARCLVDDCVLEGKEPVEYLYREEPDSELQGEDDEPDSGWRIRGRQGDAGDDEMEARSVSYVALGAVLNRDDSWLHLIEAPPGSAFMRDFATGKFEAVTG